VNELVVRTEVSEMVMRCWRRNVRKFNRDKQETWQSDRSNQSSIRGEDRHDINVSRLLGRNQAHVERTVVASRFDKNSCQESEPSIVVFDHTGKPNPDASEELESGYDEDQCKRSVKSKDYIPVTVPFRGNPPSAK